MDLGWSRRRGEPSCRRRGGAAGCGESRTSCWLTARRIRGLAARASIRFALAPETAIALTDQVQLTRLAAGEEPALLRGVRPVSHAAAGDAASPRRKTAPVAAGPLSVLKAAGPGTGSWPGLHTLRATQPQLVLWPLETTYPPEVAQYLATQVATARVEAQAAVEVISDGQRFWLVRHSAVSPRMAGRDRQVRSSDLSGLLQLEDEIGRVAPFRANRLSRRTRAGTTPGRACLAGRGASSSGSPLLP